MKKPEISTRQRIEAVRQYRLESILAEDQAAKAAAEKVAKKRAPLSEESQQKKNAYQREYQRQRQFDPEFKEKQRQYREKLKEKRKNDPEYRAKCLERERAYAKRRSQKEQEERENLFDDSDDSELLEDPSTMAALMNQKYDYSTICAEGHKYNRVVIVEHLHRVISTEDQLKRYRVKVTQYYYHSDMEAVRKWAEGHKIKLKESKDYKHSDDV